MTHAMPAILVGLTALVTSVAVHVGFAIWWFSESLLRANAASYDWAGALAVSGTATTIVLIAGLVIRRMVAGNTPPVQAKAAAANAAVPARVAVHADR